MKSTTANIVMISLLSVVVIGMAYYFYGTMDYSKSGDATGTGVDKDGNPISLADVPAKG